MGIRSIPVEVIFQRVERAVPVTRQRGQELLRHLHRRGAHPARAWGVLSTLAESGPLTQIELATTMAIDRTAMVYLLDDLEQQALVQRVRSPQDRRAFLIHLTPGGQKTQRRAAAALDGAAETLLTPLDEAERRHLVDLLAKIAAHWQQFSATQPQSSAPQPPRTTPTARKATGNEAPTSPRAPRRLATPNDRRPHP